MGPMCDLRPGEMVKVINVAPLIGPDRGSAD